MYVITKNKKLGKVNKRLAFQTLPKETGGGQKKKNADLENDRLFGLA